ncbi:MAG: hypothetical protein ACK4NS_04370 [Saprospiraceae bacterium]
MKKKRKNTPRAVAIDTPQKAGCRDLGRFSFGPLAPYTNTVYTPKSGKQNLFSRIEIFSAHAQISAEQHRYRDKIF